ncbi:MAG: response regulator, partial [Planctomycetes bacterium]|nr:response regulator [Planctomycetota bacterium]
MSLNVVVYTKDLNMVKDVLNLLACEGTQAHLFTTLDQCENFLGNNDVDKLYLCIEYSNNSQKIAERLKYCAKSPNMGVIFHYGTDIDLKHESPVSTSGLGSDPSKEIPNTSGDEINKPSKSHDIKGNKPRKILLAEDDRNIAKIILHKLQTMGYDVIHVVDGKDALAKAKEILPCLLILDVMMPKYTGTEVARILRMDARFNAIPILMMTASTSDEIERSALEGGVDKFLRKPFEMGKLIEAVES